MVNYINLNDTIPTTGTMIDLTVSGVLTSSGYIVLAGSPVATTGSIRAPKGFTFAARNQTNSGDNSFLSDDSANGLIVGGTGYTSSTLRAVTTTLSITSGLITCNAAIVAPGIINTIAYVVGTSATTDSTRLLPSDGYVTSVQVKLITPYSVGATISVGQSGSVSLFAATTDINPQGTAADIYAVEQWTQAASAAAVRVTVGGSPAAGQCVVIIKYTQPSA